ncbi:Microcephalin [Psilocybe cubensis]|uniref:BRCT domain-containing protein n=2 Tax=Psilocybe cubensis TaxID=181762 RepID=A0A8H7Y7Q2_PSICU|nr:Microcephalin [Psilocybe cubensis]KAH9485040.1 Microcephalin [Psilocybe cubensis]
MANATIFPEKRTRSQISLPDAILQIPHGSPMKDARSALRNHTTATIDTTTSSEPKQTTDDTEDELLLSPGKQASLMRAASNSKRSASPPLQDEYTPPSGSSPEGRLLKRAKRELGPLDGSEGGVKDIHSLSQLHKPSNTESPRKLIDTSPTTSRRSARKRSTTNKKVQPTLSASPPPSTFSPILSTSKQPRAQSVPLFSTSHDIPHIDFRNPPHSPRRSRSRSKSPSKTAEPRLRPLFVTFPVIEETPSAYEDGGTPMELDDEAKGVAKKASEFQSLSAPEQPLEPQSNTAVTARTSSSPPISPSPSATYVLGGAPATPASHSLDTSIPMSPLTPLPETPLPVRLTNADSRYSSNLGWGLPLITETTESSGNLELQIAVESSTIQSRLPRPAVSMPPPPLPPSRLTRPGITGSSRPVSNKAGPPTKVATATSSKNPNATVTKKDAFALMMKKSREDKERIEREKNRQPPANIFTPITTAKRPGSRESLKMKMKDKMRPKMKSKQDPATQPPLNFDDEEQEEEEEIEKESGSKYYASTQTIVESGPSTQSEIAPVIIPDPPISPTRIALDSLRSSSLPEESNMEIVEDSEGEGQALMHPAVAAAYPGHVSANPGEGQTISELGVDTSLVEQPLAEVMQPVPTIAVEALKEISTKIEGPEHEVSPTDDNVASQSAENVSEQQQEEEAQTEIRPPSRTRVSRLPLGKKRQPAVVIPGGRVTRSASNNKKNGDEAEASTSQVPSKPSNPSGIVTTKRPVSKVMKKSAEAVGSSKTTEEEVGQEKMVLPPGSPMKVSSPSKTLRPITPKKTPGRFTFSNKPISSPSPTKVVRSSSLTTLKSSSFAGRAFPMAPSQVAMGANSSLSTLSNALEKLRMPPPARPSTSMGFNRDAPGDSDDEKPATMTKDDVGVGRTSFGLGRPQGLKRASTLEEDSFGPTAKNAAASSSKSAGSTGKKLVQKPLSMFMQNKATTSKNGTSHLLRNTGKPSLLNGRPLFVVGGGVRRTISKKSTLPVVIGSPVKGGAQMMHEDDEVLVEDAPKEDGDNGESHLSAAPQNSSSLSLDELSTTAGTEKGKGKERDHDKTSKHARRVSMASHALSLSLSALPPPQPLPQRGLMGPPPTPPHGIKSPQRSTSSSYPSTSAGGSSPSQPAHPTGTRSSARIAKIAPAVQKAKTDGMKKAVSEPTPPPNPNIEALKVLKDCVIFVDVKTDTGDEAGSLFVEMLEGVGARVLTRVGQTCTHIVYKNGLMSTLSRYKLLRDPKPLVVGIAWVVECVEQRKHVDETDFLVDIESTNIAGIHKRRRSVLPKLLSSAEFETPSSEADKEEDPDRSMEGSTSSLTADDDLTPLERARRRKSLMIGLHP